MINPHITLASTLRTIEDLPTFDTETFTRWADGHPATGGRTNFSHRHKFTVPRLTREDFPPALAAPLQEALVAYAVNLPDWLLENRLRVGKTCRLLDTTYPALLRHLTTSYPQATPTGWPERWQVTSILSPSALDLLDRDQFLRACHWSHLRAVPSIPNFFQ